MIRFDNKTRANLYGALKEAFPDAKVGDQDLVALGICLRRARARGEGLPPALAQIDLAAYASQLDDVSSDLDLPELERASQTRPSGDETKYYWVEAHHVRKTPDGFEPFSGELAMVRVTLPQTYPKSFSTCIGSVEPGDHLIDTVFEANQKYARYLPQPIGRVDVITPPRQGVRFGAISVLLGYATPESELPFCYILEAGTATGQPKVLYLGRNMDVTINAYSGYQPTPFACPSHAYTGNLTMQGEDPKQLTITSRKVDGGTSQPPYIEIDAQFSVQMGPHVSTIWPGFLIARAASIVLLRNLKGTIDKDCDMTLPGART